METFLADVTELCAPSDSTFLAWLEGVPNRRVKICGREPAAAYLIQSTQSRDYPVPQVADKQALLRVFVTATRKTDEKIPPVLARFYLDGSETYKVTISGKSAAIPTEVDEGSLEKSSNGTIPARVVRPGLEMVIEIDPEDTLDEDLLVVKRIPEEGRLELEVHSMPDFELTLIPFLWTEDPDSSVLDSTEGTGALGVAYQPGYVSFSIPDSAIIAHELGHNLNLLHAPCGGAGSVDPSFPQPDGKIGVWGYDYRLKKLLPPSTHDLMSYCRPQWISDYHFSSMVRYRKSAANLGEHPNPLPTGPTMLLWGGVDSLGVPYLESAFVVDAAPIGPRGPGPFTLNGMGPLGAELFSISFNMDEIPDGEGKTASFAFLLPVQAEWAGSLASSTLSGPDGSATLDGDTDAPMAIVRDARSGQVRAFWRGLRDPPTLPSDFELYWSRGIPDREAWER